MLTENFSSIELGDAAAYAPYFRALPLHAADYTFTNLWGWGTHYNLEWRTAHGLCWIRQKRNDLPVERLDRLAQVDLGFRDSKVGVADDFAEQEQTV